MNPTGRQVLPVLHRIACDRLATRRCHAAGATHRGVGKNKGKGKLARLSALTLLVTLTSSFRVTTANAQSSSHADAVYSGWLKAYLIQSGRQTYFANSLSDRSMAFMWGQAYMITGVEDAYDQNHGADRKQLIGDLLTTFEAKNGADLSWDSWNDDAAWATIALIRGYQITNNAAFLSAATKAWNMAYARGWDSTYGGGIWENMSNVPGGGKCGLSNWPFVISGASIYQSTQDAAYLTKSEQIYAWSRANVFDATTGRVHEQVGPKGVSGDDNAYNSGLIVNAANALYQITGNVQYYNDAALAAKHVIGKYSIMTEDHPANGDFGGDQFFRGLSAFARQNHLWSTYLPWLESNGNAAWTNRRTDYNVSMNNFTLQTPMNNLRAMEAEGSVVVQLVVAQGDFLADGGAGGPLATEAGAAGDGGSTDAEATFADAPLGAGANGGGTGGGAAGVSGGGGVGDSGDGNVAIDAGRGTPAGNAASRGVGDVGASGGCGCVILGSASSKRGPGGLGILALGSMVAFRRRRKR